MPPAERGRGQPPTRRGRVVHHRAARSTSATTWPATWPPATTSRSTWTTRRATASPPPSRSRTRCSPADQPVADPISPPHGTPAVGRGAPSLHAAPPAPAPAPARWTGPRRWRPRPPRRPARRGPVSICTAVRTPPPRCSPWPVVPSWRRPSRPARPRSGQAAREPVSPRRRPRSCPKATAGQPVQHRRRPHGPDAGGPAAPLPGPDPMPPAPLWSALNSRQHPVVRVAGSRQPTGRPGPCRPGTAPGPPPPSGDPLSGGLTTGGLTRRVRGAQLPSTQPLSVRRTQEPPSRGDGGYRRDDHRTVAGHSTTLGNGTGTGMATRTAATVPVANTRARGQERLRLPDQLHPGRATRPRRDPARPDFPKENS
jgi:hypothetical protein